MIPPLQPTPVTAEGQVGSVGVNFVIGLTGVSASGYVGSLRLLWELIDDSQTANWQNIDDAQTAAWAAIDNAQSSSFSNTSTTQTPGWGTMDNAQTSQWELAETT
jgi:hypothetical protein